MNDLQPGPDWLALLGAAALGVLGRLYVVARADKRPMGWALVWELLLGVPLGIVGWGFGVLLGIGGAALPAWTVLVAIAGTRAVEAALDAVVDRIRKG